MNILSPKEMRELDSKYDSIKTQSKQLVSEELSKGDVVQFTKGKEMGGISKIKEGVDIDNV